MAQNPLLTATELKQEAGQLLASLRLEERIAPFGQMKIVGSMATDLMTWRDLDLQVQLRPGATSVDLFNALFVHYNSVDSVRRLVTIHFKGGFKPQMPRGHSFGIVAIFPKEPVQWKVDIWVLAPQDQAKSDAWMEQMERQLSPASRELILRMKQRMMVGGRVPQGGSYLLYQLVLAQSIANEQQLEELLQQHGFSNSSSCLET